MELEILSMVAWSIWRRSNEKVWSSTHATAAYTMFLAKEALCKGEGKFIACRSRFFDGLPCVKEGEAIGMLEAMAWVQSLGYQKV